MNRLTVFQVSDTHLSKTHAYFQDNWDAFIECVDQEQPDFVFVTGDMCFNGPVNSADLTYARQQMDRLSVPWRAIPGNHDIGDVPPDVRLNHPISKPRRIAYREHFGAEYWVEDLAEWRFIGLNAQLMGSNLPDEPEQMRMLEASLASAGNRNLALLIHKPLFNKTPEESETSLATVFPEPRRALLSLCEKYGVKLIASGHRHGYRATRHAGLRLVWAPATAFVDSRKPKDAPRIVRRSGYVRYRFVGAKFTCELVEPPRFVSHDMRNWMSSMGSTTKLPARALASSHNL